MQERLAEGQTSRSDTNTSTTRTPPVTTPQPTMSRQKKAKRQSTAPKVMKCCVCSHSFRPTERRAESQHGNTTNPFPLPPK